MAQKECEICFETCDLFLKCNCEVCVDCIQKYIENKISDYRLSDGSHLSLKCPGHCQNTLYFDHILEIATRLSFEEKLQEQLFRKYCQRADDILACPNSHCNFYYLQPCKQKCESVCELCNYRIENRREILSQRMNNYKTKVYEFFTTQPCPQCNVLILKNGGCPHMTCQNCTFEFCWDCKQGTTSHDWMICIYHNLFFLFTKILLGYQILYELTLHQYVIQLLTYIASLTYWYKFNNNTSFVINNTILALTYLLLSQIKRINELEDRQERKLARDRSIFASITLTTLISVAYFVIQITFCDWIYYIFQELILSLIGVIIISVVITLYNIVIKSKTD